MVVSDTVSYPDVYGALEDFRVRAGRPINVTVLTSAEVESRQRRNDSFLTRVLAQPKLWIIGSDDVLTLR
jgi:hypothetical protein